MSLIKLGFKDRYRVLHLSNELGRHIVGGVATHVDEQYRYRDADTGFLHYREHLNFSLSDYDDSPTDIALITADDVEALTKLDFDILVLHFFNLVNVITHELLRNRKLVYVVHSVPTPQPVPKDHPFGGHYDIEQKVNAICDHAAAVIAVSDAELDKLKQILPQHAHKAVAIANGITLPIEPIQVIPLAARHCGASQRLRLGYIARMDYRKGLLETLKAIRRLDVDLHVACDTGEPIYTHLINEYLEAVEELQGRVHWHGFCIGERKKAFFDYVDVVVMPSLYEPFGYTVMEAVMHGKPLIVSNNSGMREIVGPDYAYQFDPYDLPTYIAMLRRYLEEPSEAIVAQMERLIERLSLFEGKAMVRKYQEFLKSL